MATVYVIDDEGGTGYVENVIQLLQVGGEQVNLITDVSEARKRLAELLSADILIIDLMMPERDQNREIPAIASEVGLGLCEEIIAAGYIGSLKVLTNATWDRHAAQLRALEDLSKATGGRLAVTFKYQKSALQFSSELLQQEGQ